MKANYKWLKELADFDWSPQELADKLTLAGLEVESVTPRGQGLKNIIVGLIVKIEKHPVEEKLTVCSVDTGKEILPVVCGAKNAKAGIKAPLALIGAELPGGNRIEKVTFEKIESLGMLCSEKELGIGEESEGIMILEGDHKIGIPLSQALDLEDFVFDFDLTPNRPDACSIIGIARDIAALSGGKLKKPTFDIEETKELTSDWVNVLIEDTNGCPRYAARIIKDIKISKSPFWLRRKLECCGLRSINNVVDITNFVLLETGHPLHAFDYDLFASSSGKPNKKVLIRRAKDKEKFITLDEIERNLNPEVLLITDGSKPVALAGIMGGLESEVTEKTTNILLESAYFNPRVIRRGRLSLGLNTEASYRFERGADPNIVVKSADRAAHLMHQLCEGKISKGTVDNYPEPIEPLKLSFRPEKCSSILGADIKQQKIDEIFDKLEIKVNQRNKDGTSVEVPTFRPDLTREIDLIEEVARIYGYDKIGSNLKVGGGLLTTESEEERFSERIKNFLVGKGCFEVISNNLVDPLKMTKLNPLKNAVRVLNPLNEEHSILTTSLSYNLLSIISWNLNRKEKDLRVFELGKVYWEEAKNVTEEKLQLEIAICGIKTPLFWGEKNKKVDFYDLKGMIEDLLYELKIKDYNFSQKSSHLLAEGISSELQIKGKQAGFIGKVSDEILNLFDIEEEIFLAELDFPALSESVLPINYYKALPRFPGVERDISLIMEEGILSRDMEKAIREIGGGLVERVSVFDYYKGPQVPAGKKSLAYTIWFRSGEKTLTEEEVEKVIKKILEGLKTSFGAEQRQ